MPLIIYLNHQKRTLWGTASSLPRGPKVTDCSWPWSWRDAEPTGQAASAEDPPVTPGLSTIATSVGSVWTGQGVRIRPQHHSRTRRLPGWPVGEVARQGIPDV